MYYKIIEKFGPEDGEKWESYIQWRGLELTSFDSVDGMLRPDVFQPETGEDWNNCVKEAFKTSLITNIGYARRVLDQHEESIIVGVDIELEEVYVPGHGLLGYDIIDGYCDISLVTNWGTDEENIFSKHVMHNGLIGELELALRIRDTLRREHQDDDHAEACEVWAIYYVDPAITGQDCSL